MRGIKKLKNIALLIGAIDSDPQADILEGIREFGISRGCNISVFVFFSSAVDKIKHNTGEFNIFNLPNFDLYDGIIVELNTLYSDDIKEKVIKKLSQAKCPVVSINYEFNNSYFVGTDNYLAMKKVVEHMVKEHNFKRINYVSGPEFNI